MHTGMLWYDNNSKVELENRVARAADYYRRKYHRLPNLCLVNPRMLAAGSSKVGALTVRAYAPVLPGHFWIGIEDEKP